MGSQRPCRRSSRRFHFDDIGSEVGEQPTAELTTVDGQVDDTEPGERQTIHGGEIARYDGDTRFHGRNLPAMCRNITTLRGLEPEATAEEIEAAARQYVRKVSGVQKPSARTDEAFERAVGKVLEATAELLTQLPPRQQPPRTLPPLRRLATAERLRG